MTEQTKQRQSGVTVPPVGSFSGSGGADGDDGPSAPPLRISTLDGWHLRAVRVDGGGIIVTLERAIGKRGILPLSFDRRVSQAQAEQLRDWLVKVL